MLRPKLVERILLKLGLADRPRLDLIGLNDLYAAWCGNIPFDNVQKRIWFAGDQTHPITGGDPIEFFENWLAHGTGGTCWPTGGGMYTLLRSLSFNARRIAGSMTETDSRGRDAGHGSVLVTIEAVDYLVDPSMLAFEVLPLIGGEHTEAGQGIHAIEAIPIDDRFNVLWYPAHMRDTPATFSTQPEHDPVDHTFFLEGYERSRQSGPFNDALYICRRHPQSIDTLGRKNRITVAPNGEVTVTKIPDAERTCILIDEFGLSEEIAYRLPPDAHNA